MCYALGKMVSFTPDAPTSFENAVNFIMRVALRRRLIEDLWISFITKRVMMNATLSNVRNILRLPMESDSLEHVARTTSQAKEGSSRESKKDYLHFLYISRGSLSETQYFIHLARRLNYLSEDEAAVLNSQTKLTFACLHGLIQAVEKETGKLGKLAATLTSLLVIGCARWSSGQFSVVS